MPTVKPFSDEQLRQLVNLRTRYEVWIAADRALGAMPYDLRKKQVGEYAYLYEIFDRSGNGKSLGALTPGLERKFDEYQSQKLVLKERIRKSWAAVEETGRLCRGLRLPMLSSEAGVLLREADRREMLGEQLMVVGTNAMPAYAVEAAGLIRDAPDETEDFDLAWVDEEGTTEGRTLWAMLKAVDSTYTVNTERTFQARNARAYEVEVLVAPSRSSGMGRRDQPRPVPLAEQEWLLHGRTVDQIVICRDATPARIVAPDPRWFALQKLWMSEQPKRNPLKRRKDELQATALLNAVAETMPQYPINAEFVDNIPDELRPMFRNWQRSRTA